MPMQFHNAISPGGLAHLLVEVWGRVELEDGLALDALLHDDRSHHGGYIFARVAKGTEYSLEVRRFFNTMDDTTVEVAAAVVTSPIVRASLNLIIRFAGRDAVFRMFLDDQEAWAWLESCARSSR